MSDINPSGPVLRTLLPGSGEGSRFYFGENYRFLSRGEAPAFLSRPYSRVNSGEKVPHFNGLKVPLLGKIKQDQRSLFSTGPFHPDLRISLKADCLTTEIPEDQENFRYNDWLFNNPLIMVVFLTDRENFIVDSRFMYEPSRDRIPA